MDKKIPYFINFHLWGLKSVLKKQMLKLSEIENEYATNRIAMGEYKFLLSKTYIEEWNTLYGIEDDNKILTFTFHWPWVIQGLVEKLIPFIGANLKNYLHIGHEGTFHTPYIPDGSQSYIAKHRLLDICPNGKNKIVILTDTKVFDEASTLVYSSADYSLVLNINERDMRKLDDAQYFNKEPINKVYAIKSRRPKLIRRSKYNSCTIHVDKKMGIHFGLVSGALNPTHTYKYLSKLFGHKKPFLQGMCTGNLILKVLSHDLGENIKSCSMFFSNKVFLPQDLYLRYSKKDFELFDEEGNIVAFGSRKQKIVSSSSLLSA